MKEVQAIVKDIYGIKDPVDTGVNLNNKVESAQIKAMRENYQLYYSNMKAMGKDKKWNDKQLAEALKDKEQGLKTYQSVSYNFNLCSLLFLLQWINRNKNSSVGEKAVFKRLMDHAENKQAEKERIAREKEMYEADEARVLADRNRQKVLQERGLRTKE